jgi:hypothetical protein
MDYKTKRNLVVVILATALVAGVGVYFFYFNTTKTKPLMDVDSSLKISPNKENFDGYLYALNRLAENKNIANNDVKQTYNKIERYGDTVKGGAVYSGALIEQYKEINVNYQLAKNKLDTIKSPELNDSLFDLTQSIDLYTEINNETVRFYQHLNSVYILNKQDNYQAGNKPNINTAFLLLKESFSKMDSIISGDYGAYLSTQNIDNYKNLRNIILSVD